MEYLRKALELINSKRAILTALLSLAALMLTSAVYYLGLKVIFLSLFLIGIFAAAGYLLYLYIKTGKNPKSVDLFNDYLKERAKQLKQIGIKRFTIKPSPFAHLPWYILIGSPASGKTSVLKNSGIHFPALESKDSVDCDALKDIEQNAHCDWWFANHAVFIDTAGWYMSGGQATKHWQILLKQLKRLKRQQALNGVVLTIDYSKLEQQEVNLELEQLRARIEELYQNLGYLLPVQLLVTHCDLMPGFDAFFSSLDEPSKAQVWGMDFSSESSLEQQLAAGMDKLYQRLNARLFNQVHLQQDNQQKMDQIRFPQQFIALKAKLARMVDEMAKDNIYQEKFNLAGIYFTSATASNGGYFIHDLLQNKLKYLGQQTSYCATKKKKLKQQHYGFWAALATGFVLSLSVLISSFTYNNNLLKEGDNLVSSMVYQGKNPTNLAAKLVFLNAAGAHFLKLSEFKKREPWYHKLGMSRVSSQKIIYQQFLAKALERDFYQQIKSELVKELSAYHKNWQTAGSKERERIRGDYYADLKAYLMLNFPQHIDKSFASQHLAEKWRAMYVDTSGESLANDSLARLSRFYLDYMTRLDKAQTKRFAHYQTAVVNDARRDLLTRSGVSNWYAQLSLQLRRQSGFLTLDQFVDDAVVADLWLADSKIPAIFSRKGYLQDVKPAFERLAKSSPRKDWVIHGHLDRLAKNDRSLLREHVGAEQQKKIIHELNALYYQHYLDAWLRFIASVKVVNFNSLDDASQQLRALYQSEGAYSYLFKKLHSNLALAEFVDKANYQIIPEYLRQRFKEIEQLTASYPKPNALLEQYNKQLTVMQQDIERLSIGSELAMSAEHYVSSLLMSKGQDTEVYKTSLMVDSLVNQLNGLSSRQAFKSLLLSPAQETYRALLLEAMQGVQAEWQAGIYRLYQDRLAQRFPFNPRGQDANLADVIDFYKPRNGLLASFIHERINPYIQQQGNRFVLRTWLGIKPPFNPDFLNWLAKEKGMSQALFPSDSNELKVRFMLYPMPTPGLKEILFVSNGQTYPYRNGPQEWVNFSWPGQDNMDNESFIRVTQSFADAQSAKEYQGVWGLFHLLHSAKRVIKMNRGYKLQWQFAQAGNKSVQMILGAKTSTNPFEALLFKPQAIPERLID